MQGCISIAIALTLLVTGGCQRKPALPPQSPDELAAQVREAILDPAIKNLPAGERTSEIGLAGMRQVEAALLSMRQLIACGSPAIEPLERLIEDENPEVRQVSIMLLGMTRTDESGEPFDSETLTTIHIPLLEKGLTSPDPRVRYFAASGLGDLSDFSDECLARLNESLPLLEKLLSDTDSETRNMGFAACNKILAELSRRAKTAAERSVAEEKWKNLNSAWNH